MWFIISYIYYTQNIRKSQIKFRNSSYFLKKSLNNFQIFSYHLILEIFTNAVSLLLSRNFEIKKVSNFRMDTMLHICEGFNITLKDFFDDPLFNEVIAE